MTGRRRVSRAFALAFTAAISTNISLAGPREDALAQWRQVESVLTSPRCLNCHTSTEYPRQGDDRHRHTFRVMRGAEGHGMPVARCAMCHQTENAAAAGIPGASGWHLAPPSMSWERAPGVQMTSRELCTMLTDRRRNGGRTPAELVKHHAEEPLVAWAWSPGTRADGTPRATPPIEREAFIEATRAWAGAGAPCP